MAKKICQKCGQEKTIANFIAVNSPLHCGSLPLCRDCLNSLIAAEKSDEQWKVVDKICQWADVPFLPAEWEKVKKRGKDALGIYMAMFRSSQYSDLDWNSYNKVYLDLEKEKSLQNILPGVKENQLQKLQAKWGEEYDNEQLEYLENLHICNHRQTMKSCRIQLLIQL